jgi:hypothetical protein
MFHVKHLQKKEKKMHNDSYSVEELLAELSQELGLGVGTVNDDGRAVLTRYELQAIIAKLNAKCHNNAPQGDYRLTADGDRVWAVGGFITYD